MTYCIVPRELALKLHDPLHRHFRDDPGVEVVVEKRGGERRAAERRRRAKPRRAERRLIRNPDGRRTGERRTATAPVEPPKLPRRFQRHAGRLTFVERLEPAGRHREDLDTARLVTRIQAGDRKAFATLYTRYFSRVYAYLRALLNDPDEAEDAAQQVFTQVLEALPRYERRPGQPFRAWLFAAARNYGLAHVRKHHGIEVMDPAEVIRRLDEAGGGAELATLGWISDPDLLMFVERLPLPQRQVLLLRFMLGLNSKEMGKVLDRSPEDVRILQHRAIHYLKEHLTALKKGTALKESTAVKEDTTGRRRAPASEYPRQATVLRARRWALWM